MGMDSLESFFFYRWGPCFGVSHSELLLVNTLYVWYWAYADSIASSGARKSQVYALVIILR
jgi:hypothetical protein